MAEIRVDMPRIKVDLIKWYVITIIKVEEVVTAVVELLLTTALCHRLVLTILKVGIN